MSSIDASVFQTWNPVLRLKRYEELVNACAKVAALAENSPYGVKVTGSLSRGQIHPWSDLDIILYPAGAFQPVDRFKKVLSSYDFEEAAELGHQEVQAVHVGEIIEPMKRGMLGSAVAINDIPVLGDLPDPALAIPRCAVGMEIVVKNVEREIAEINDDKHAGEVKAAMQRAVYGMARDRLVHRVDIATKRLAVFQDGGQSNWLNDLDDLIALAEMVKRLQQPATEPFKRPPVLTERAGEAITWLIGRNEYDVMMDQGDQKKFQTDFRNCLHSLKDWAGYLRLLDAPTETHGLIL